MWDMGLGTIAGDFGALSEDEYDEMTMEAEEQIMDEVVDVVKILDGDSDDDEGDTENVEDEDNKGGDSDDEAFVIMGAGTA